MSNNLVINPHLATSNYSGQLAIRSLLKGIRSSSFRGTNIYKPQNFLPYLSYQPMGGFEPDLNGYLTSTTESVLPVGVEFESNCSRIAVNVRFPQAIHSPRHLKECLTSSVVQEILRIAQSPRSGS